MKKEEAIQVLQTALTSPFVYGKYAEAIDMAIESLQKDIERYKMVRRASEMHLGLVRCKDCKHHSDGKWCDVYIQPRMDTDFCNHGERYSNYGELKAMKNNGN